MTENNIICLKITQNDKKKLSVTDGPTDGPTNGRTDRAGYRVAYTRLKNVYSHSNMILKLINRGF